MFIGFLELSYSETVCMDKMVAFVYIFIRLRVTAQKTNVIRLGANEKLCKKAKDLSLLQS